MNIEQVAIADTSHQSHHDLGVAHDIDPATAEDLRVVEMKKEFDDAKSIKILISGKVGVGKSTLTNAILGTSTIPKATEHSDITMRGTTEVTEYTNTVEGIDVTVWDTPGLQDGTTSQPLYLQQIEEKCVDRDLTIYCVKCGGTTRFVEGNEDILAMKKFTEKFGKQFWDNTVIILTFANLIPAFHPKWKSLPEDKLGEMVRKNIDTWKIQVKKLLRKEIRLDEEIVDRIQIVPAGHYSEVDIPGFQSWLTDVWLACFEIIKEAPRTALIKLNTPRLLTQETVDPNFVILEPKDHPLNTQKIFSRFVKATAYTAGAAATGSGIGGIVGGVLGHTVGTTLASQVTASLTIAGNPAMAAIAAKQTSVICGFCSAFGITAGMTIVGVPTAGFAMYLLYKKYKTSKP